MAEQQERGQRLVLVESKPRTIVRREAGTIWSFLPEEVQEQIQGELQAGHDRPGGPTKDDQNRRRYAGYLYEFVTKKSIEGGDPIPEETKTIWQLGEPMPGSEPGGSQIVAMFETETTIDIFFWTSVKNRHGHVSQARQKMSLPRETVGAWLTLYYGEDGGKATFEGDLAAYLSPDDPEEQIEELAGRVEELEETLRAHRIPLPGEDDEDDPPKETKLGSGGFAANPLSMPSLPNGADGPDLDGPPPPLPGGTLTSGA